MYWTALLHKR